MLTGHRLGAYQVQERIGAGGMGEVYRTRDTKLVATSRSNIGAISGFEEADGTRGLVLEFVEGETLADFCWIAIEPAVRSHARWARRTSAATRCSVLMASRSAASSPTSAVAADADSTARSS